MARWNLLALTVVAAFTRLVSSQTSAPAPTQLHPNGNTSKCLEVRGGVLANGTAVQIFDCNGTPAQNWVLSRGTSGHVTLNGTNFCLDAGSTPANGIKMKIWQCFDNLPAQNWFYTVDDRVALTNQGFCLDNTGGSMANTNQAQIWTCTDGDTNQVWTSSAGTPPPVCTPVGMNAVSIHPSGASNKCLDVQGALFANGTTVQIFDCNSSPAQQWQITAGGHITVGGKNFCLDAGSTPANGVSMKIWQCFDNLAAQTWNTPDAPANNTDVRITLGNSTAFCVDNAGGLLTNGNKVQTWACNVSGKNQAWFTTPACATTTSA